MRSTISDSSRYKTRLVIDDGNVSNRLVLLTQDYRDIDNLVQDEIHMTLDEARTLRKKLNKAHKKGLL